MERSSPLTQRVRRLLGTRELQELAASPATAARPGPALSGDTGALFESQLSQLAATVAELQAADRHRDAELRALRSIVRLADERARGLGPVVAELDELICAGRALLEAPEEPAPSTLFERMRARMGAASRLDPRQREVLADLLARLGGLREQIRACAAAEER